MQPNNWNDLRVLLAVKRGQTLGAAARQLHVDDTTVSRRLAALQSELGARLVERHGHNRLMLTEVGEAVVRQAEAIEHRFELVREIVSHGEDTGTVRVTSVAILTNRLFVRAVPQLAAEHPGLTVELIPEGRNLNLALREADVAVRLARPTLGGLNIRARRIGRLDYAVYVAKAVSLREARRLPWIAYQQAMSHLPQARWMAAAAKGDDRELCNLRVHDAETALEAAASGLGKTLLPSLVADRDMRLRSIDPGVDRPCPAREIWLLAHSDQLALAKTTAVMDWIARTIFVADRQPKRKRADV